MTDEQITASAQSRPESLRDVEYDSTFIHAGQRERESLAIVGCGFPLNCTSLEHMDGRRARRGEDLFNSMATLLDD